MANGIALQEGLKMVWANPSPFERFVGQKIPLDLTNVNRCIIAVKDLSNADFPEHKLKFYDVNRSTGNEGRVRIWGTARLETNSDNASQPIMLTRRYVVIENDGIVISDASNKVTNKTSSAGTYNNYFIPCAIYIENV